MVHLSRIVCYYNRIMSIDYCVLKIISNELIIFFPLSLKAFLITMLLANSFLSFQLHPVFLTGYVLSVGSKYLQCDNRIADLRYFFPD